MPSDQRSASDGGPRQDRNQRDAPQTPPRIVRSADLLQGGNEVWIEHGDEMYRLRVTSAGKLLLTK